MSNDERDENEEQIAEREQLVAYLDGELSADDRREVETRLAQDEAYRLEMQALERSWQTLDELPRQTANDSFAQTTVEMVALAAEEELAETQAMVPVKRRRQWMLGACAIVAAACCGFFVTGWLLSDPNDQLVQDLPILEDLDVYQQIGDIEFPQLLLEEGLFKEDEENSSTDEAENVS